MVKTGQFTTECKGDRVLSLKRQISVWYLLHPDYHVKHAFTSESCRKSYNLVLM